MDRCPTDLGRARRALRPAALLAGLLLLTAAASGRVAAVSEGDPSSAPSDDLEQQLAAHEELVDRYCVRCHNDKLERGSLSLESFEVGRAQEQAEIAEKMIRKLQTGMMPPSPGRRPDDEAIDALVEYMAGRIDQAAAANPDPGVRTFQRLNRAEYERSVEDLLALEVDAEAFLPADTVSHGFDNIADVQSFSPTLMEGYLRAAARISRQAIGDPDSAPAEVTYKIPRTASQRERVEGAPYGTRGGLSQLHDFPADGDYVFKLMLHSTPTGQLFGSTALQERLEVSIDGERVALLEIDPLMDESDPNGMNLQTPTIPVKAGPHNVTAAFLEQASGPIDDLIAPIDHTLADTQIGLALGVTTLPHLRQLSVSGPYNVSGGSATPSREVIFSCRPTEAGEEGPCATEIVTRLASQAYRRPIEDQDLEGLMSFYTAGAQEDGFEAGIRLALQAILASPHFLFRLERVPADVENAESYRISDLDLASRLSYFLWGSGPDRELIDLASSDSLSDPEVLEHQVRRMLEDPRSEALSTRFAAQWLRLQDLDKIHPDALQYSSFDRTLAEAMRRETELFFDHLVRTDRSVLELLTADYTFLNERLARHYGLGGVSGNEFRRVELSDETRRGLLGHGSILTLTSHANRTSAVLRGKWVMEVLLGSPPPPPPPNVPDLEATADVIGGRQLTVREQMAEHRSNPACTSCHLVIDPIGLALENFDVTGAWRTRDNGVPIDSTGRLYDGTQLHGPTDLREALAARSEVIVTTFTENLLAYGTGRRVEYDDMPAVRQITQRAADSEYRISSFVLGVVSSDAFQMRRSELAATPTENDPIDDRRNGGSKR